jgi:hypothetical protein
MKTTFRKQTGPGWSSCMDVFILQRGAARAEKDLIVIDSSRNAMFSN